MHLHMKAITGFGKYIFALPFAVFAIFHFLRAQIYQGYVPFPGGTIWVYLSGLGMLLAAVAIITGKKDGLATFLLGVLLLIYALSIHLPNALNAPGGDWSSFLKDTAMAGGAWMYAHSLAKEPVK